MKVIIQRVTKACVNINNLEKRSIEKGFVVLVGITHNDIKDDADFLAKKCCGLRVFEDENEKLNVSLKDAGGSLLIVSNFTLYGECEKGFRPSFTNAAAPDTAKPLYEYFISACRNLGVNVCTGEFGADMQIEMTADGPITIEIESCKAKKTEK